MKRQYRYQLISPINGQKIYQTASLKKATEKCYKELKESGSLNNLKDNHFIVLNVDTNEPYTYKLKNKDMDAEKIQKYMDPTQNGGGVDEEDLAKMNVILARKLDIVNSNITNIIEKMNVLENDINLIKTKTPVVINKPEPQQITVMTAPSEKKVDKENINVTCTMPTPIQSETKSPEKEVPKQLDTNKCIIL
jgi:hypothetical protein